MNEKINELEERIKSLEYKVKALNNAIVKYLEDKQVKLK